jgi:hypothetical protein
MQVEITIKATVELSEFDCDTVKALEDILIDADSIALTSVGVIDGKRSGEISIASITED